jgi:hypothetical protein
MQPLFAFLSPTTIVILLVLLAVVVAVPVAIVLLVLSLVRKSDKARRDNDFDDDRRRD